MPDSERFPHSLHAVRTSLTVLLLCSVAVLLAGCPGASTGIPDRTIVLTFDDGWRSDLEYVAPLLKEFGFRATFFSTARWAGEDDFHLTLEEVAVVHKMGFEIGSHSFRHFNHSDPELTCRIVPDIAEMADALQQVGIPRPETFAWPGNCFSPEARSVLKSRGFKFARRGAMPADAVPPALRPGLQPGRRGPHYDPTRHDPLLIPSTLVIGPPVTVEDLEWVIAGARDGKAGILQFHGVPDDSPLSTDPQQLRRFLEVLRDEDCNVIALKDLARWVDPDKHPKDRLIAVRYDQ